MDPIQLFDLASRQAQWLAVRQSVVAGNIANANTPDYRAKDVDSFESVLTGRHMSLASTHAAHFTESPLRNAIRTEDVSDGVAVRESGNSVEMSSELMKAGAVRRDFELNTSLVKSFHRMMLLTVQR